MEERMRRRALVFSWTGSAAVLAVLAAANLLSYFLFARADFSANHAYSISRGTRNLLSSLKDTLTVKVYYTPGLPPPYGLDRQYLRDLLAEYKSAGRGRVKVEFLNPDEEKRRREAMEAGVAPLQLSVMGHEKFEVKESFMGMVFLYKGKTEVVAVLNGVADLEYDITRRIKKLVSEKTKTVGFLTGHGEAAPTNPADAQLFGLVSEQLHAVPVTFDKPVPADVDAIWIWGPASPFKPAELERLKAWLDSGRSLGLLLSRRDVDFRSFYARPLVTGLEPLLAQWGLDVPEGFVADAQCEKVQMESAYGMFRAISIVDYPFIPVATGMNRGHAAVRGLEAVSFPFAHPLRYKPGTKTGLNFTCLVESSRTSWLNAGGSTRPGQAVETLVTKEEGPFCLAGVLEGDFSKVTPSTWTATLGGAAPANAAAGRVGHLIVVGTAKQIQPQFAGKGAVTAFLMNLLEWSLQDEALLSIRSKAAAYRPLRPLPLGGMLAVKYALIFFLPWVLVAAGLTRHVRKKAQRRELARNFDVP